MNSKAKATVAIYQSWFRKLCTFCEEHLHVSPHEVTTAELLLFIQDLIDKGRAPSTVGQAISAIAWYFQKADRADPTKHRLISDLVSAVKRTGPEVQHKEPATHGHLLHVQQYAAKMGTYVAARTFAIVLTLYAGCCRLDEVIGLPSSAVKVGKEKVQLYVPKSKTDQTRSGLKKSMYRAQHTTLCPVQTYEAWFQRKEVGRKKGDALFPLQRNWSKSVSETTFRENLEAALAGSDLPRIMSHSHRAGAATDAVQNHATIDQVQLLGGWRDPRSVASYVRRSEAGRAEAAQTLGL